MGSESRGKLHLLFEASVWDFPLALQRWMLGDDGSAVEAAVLKACQAWTDLANQSVERLFQARDFAVLMTSSVKYLVQWQRLARDFIQSMAANGAPGNSAPGGCEIEEMRDAMNRLRRDVRALTAKVNLMNREPAKAELH